MALIRKGGNTAPVNNRISPVEREQRYLNNQVKDQIATKKKAVSRLVGNKTTVTYYHAVINESNDYLATTSNFNDLNPNRKQYEKINNFILILDDVSYNQGNAHDNVVEYVIEGEAMIPAKDMKPSYDDIFIMVTGDRSVGYRVKSISQDTLENEAAVKISFEVLDENATVENDALGLAENISEEYDFVFQNVGTDFRTVFKTNEYVLLTKLNELYIDIENIYTNNFYDKVSNTFLLHFSQTNNPDIFENYKETAVVTKGIIGGFDCYDKELIHFIKDNNLLDTFNGRPLRVTQYYRDIGRSYYSSVFAGLVNRDRRRIRNYYQMPSLIDTTIPGVPPMLYNKFLLQHVCSLNEDCLDLFPHKFITKVKSTSAVAEIKYKEIAYSNTINFMSDLISTYINNDKMDLIEWFSFFIDSDFRDKIYYEDIILDSTIDNPVYQCHLFYIYPIFMYIIREAINMLSKYNMD